MCRWCAVAGILSGGASRPSSFPRRQTARNDGRSVSRKAAYGVTLAMMVSTARMAGSAGLPPRGVRQKSGAGVRLF